MGGKRIGYVTSEAKVLIIVKSVVVGWQNLLSNFLHLSTMGVGIPEIARGMREKFGELSEFVKNRKEIQKLQVRIGGAARDTDKVRSIEAQIRVLEDANARLSIMPLIEAGEFSTISENLTEGDVAIREGRWGDYIEKAVDMLPGTARTVAKNLLVSKDTALFQGMNRMVQYGDFIAKAVLYDHLTKTKKAPKEAALDVILEEFVQYNRLPGRGRDFLEGIGAMWFMNYKLRIMKIAVKTMRDRPLSALLMMGGIGPVADVDTVWDGSLTGALADDRLGYNLGFGMGV